jgi:hypothetical protein
LDHPPSPHEQLAIHAGGMEANGVAGDLLASRALSRGGMTARDAMRYLEFELDTLSYVLSTDEEEEPGHDVFDFLTLYNELAAATETRTLGLRTLKRESLVSLANPMLAYAAWGIGRYLATGGTSVGVPMLTIGSVRYLPLVRYRLTPLGTEWAIVNELGGSIRPTQVEVRAGRSLAAHPWGVSVRQRQLPAWPNGPRTSRFQYGGNLDSANLPSSHFRRTPGSARTCGGVSNSRLCPCGSERSARRSSSTSV